MKGARGDYKDGRWALVDAAGTPLTEYKYWFVEPWGEGYFRAMVTGSKYDLLTPEGEEVFHQAFGFIGKVENGYVLIGKTIPKTATTDTRYMYGWAHVSGVIILPPVLEYASRGDIFLQAEHEGNSVYVKPSGGVFSSDRSHLPKMVVPNLNKYYVDYANWTFPGLQFFYRDTDADFDVEKAYPIGDIVRAGFFIDATTLLLKPNRKVRYIIASAHAAQLHLNVALTGDEYISRWNLCVFHFNSYFKVMDIYRAGGVAQVLLLHIPHSARQIFGGGESSIILMDTPEGEGLSIVDLARQSLDEKMRMEVHSRSLDENWTLRTEHPIGLDDDLHRMPLELCPEPEDGPTYHLSKLVHRMAQDDDVEIEYKESDHFPYTGLCGRVCEACVFRHSINRDACGCDKLDKAEFRKRYIRGRCEYFKKSADDQSQVEKKEKEVQDKKLKKTFPMNEPMNIIREFIQERLDCNPQALMDVDLSSLREDAKFGCDGSQAFSPEGTAIARAVTSVVFRDVWPDLTYTSVKDRTYAPCRLNPMQDIFGSQILDEYFKGLVKFDPDDAFEKKVWEFNRLHYTLGNFMILPSVVASVRSTHKPVRTHMAKFLARLQPCLTGKGKPDYKILDAINAKKKTFDGLRNEEGFMKIVSGMFLEGYLKDGTPDDIFRGMCSSDKGLSRDEYLAEADRYIDHSTEIIRNRASRIFEVIMKYL